MNVEKLIEEVRRYPALYDLNNEKYKNTEYRDNIWKQIAKDLQVAAGPKACKTKWIHIRDQFRRVVRIRKSTTGMAVNTQRKYKYEDMLQFILPQMKEQDTLTNVNPEFEENNNFDSFEEIYEEDNNTCTLLNAETGNEGSTSYKHDVFVKPSKKRNDVNSPNKVTNRASSQLMAYILEKKKLVKRKDPRFLELHPVDAFLNGISPTLKALNPLLLNKAKTQIFGIVQALEMEQLLERQSGAVDPLQACVFQSSNISPLSSTF